MAQSNSQDVESRQSPWCTDSPRMREEDHIAPSADVFSYALLTTPRERLKHHGKFTVDACMSYLLVFSVLFIQAIMLYCVSNQVIAKNITWQRGIMMNTGHDWDLVDPAPKEDQCNDGKSLCRSENGTFTCAPPSVQLIGRWHILDTNKDGVWTRDEVEAAQKELQCKFVVNPVEVFGVVIGLLKQREEFIWLHPDVKSGKAIPKMYFDYIMGDVAMCGYRNGDMCGNLVKRGVFDRALKLGNVPRVGTTIRSALHYCHEMLDLGGICEKNLPSTYTVWKTKSVQECQAAKFSGFIYKHPSSGSTKALLEVDYKAQKDYAVAQSGIFIAYKTCIVFLWMLMIVSQLRVVGKTLTWAYQAPGMDPDDISPRDGKLHTMSVAHRIALTSSNIVRFVLMCVLLYVGLNFLARQTDYVGLLMDGVALILIVQTEEILYSRVLRQDVRVSAEGESPVTIYTSGPMTGRPDIKDMVVFIGILLASLAFLWYHTTTLVVPLYDALSCACSSEGDTCREVHRFGNGFWDKYWEHTVPTAIQHIKDLKAGHSTPESIDAAPSPATALALDPDAALHSGAQSLVHVLPKMAKRIVRLHHRFHDPLA